MTNEQKFILYNLLEYTKTFFKLFLSTLLLIQNIVVLLHNERLFNSGDSLWSII